MLQPNLNIRLYGQVFPAFLFFGLIGYLAGAGLGVGLTILKGLNIWILFLLCGVSAATFFALVWLVKWIKGEEDIVYYHHEIGILTTTLLTLWLIGEPVLPYLDIVLLGIGTLLAFGRWGCFSVGCCHGRPCSCRVGVKYTQEHADAGFPTYYVGVKLFPIPLLESVWVFITVIICSFLVLGDFSAGTAIVFYTVFYGTARFVFEFFRGDPERPYWGPLSEAQWTTLALVLLTMCLSGLEILPYYIGHMWVGICLGIFALIYASFFSLRSASHYRFLNPRIVEEIALTLSHLENTPANNQNGAKSISVIETSTGLHFSKGVIQLPDKEIIHYTISEKSSVSDGQNFYKAALNETLVNAIAKLLKTLWHDQYVYDIQSSQNGIFHILYDLPNKPNELKVND